MTMNRASLPKDLEEGLNAHFGDAYRELPEEWRVCFEVESSQKAFEEDVLMTGLGYAPTKSEGSAITYDEMAQGYSSRYDHETIALAVRITEEAVEDNLYYSMGPKLARGLARSLKHTKELKGANILNNATVTNGGDGVPLLSVAHPRQGGGTWSNKLATPADISEAALEDICTQIRTAEDDRGLPIALSPVRLIIPPQTAFDAHRILRSTLRPGTADNDVNALRSRGMFSNEPHQLTRLTDPDAWFVLTDCPEGLKHFIRIGVQRGMLGDFETGDARYKVRERYSFGWSDPRGIYGSEGAA